MVKSAMRRLLFVTAKVADFELALLFLRPSLAARFVAWAEGEEGMRGD
jgi:hypothetical protein